MISMISAIAMAWTVTTAPAPEPEPVTVWLGVDCSSGAEPFTVSLPDDVLTECEGELTGR